MRCPRVCAGLVVAAVSTTNVKMKLVEVLDNIRFQNGELL